MSSTLSQMEMPTLAAVVGQLRGDMLRHLPHVRSLLAATPDSVDAGCLYFPLIADKSLMEKMRSAYDELKMPVYHRRLVSFRVLCSPVGFGLQCGKATWGSFKFRSRSKPDWQ